MLLHCDVAAAVSVVAAALWSSPVENVECREGSWFPAPVFLLGSIRVLALRGVPGLKSFLLAVEKHFTPT